MQIIEQYIRGKRDDERLCEDGFVVTPHFAAVVDGSTSKVPGRNGGREAMERVCEALTHLPPEADKEEMLTFLTSCIAPHNPPEARTDAAYRLTCSAVIFSVARRVIWMPGDCQCLLGGQTYTHNKRVDEVLTRIRCEAVQYLLAHGHSARDIRRHDLGRAFIHDALREQTNFQNAPDAYNPFRYPVIDGTPIDAALVPEIAVPQGVDEIVLASDGYPVLRPTLCQTEAELQRLLHDDPLCIGGNAATKCLVAGNVSFDDRTYLRLRL